MMEFNISTFIKGDECELVSFYNNIYSEYAGFVQRTSNYWIWCCLDRPGVINESIFIVRFDGDIVGYAVVGKSGNVWEFCYNPDYDYSETIISMLLEWIIEYVDKVNGEFIKFNGLRDDEVLRNVCKDYGFSETEPESIYMSVFNLPELLNQLIESETKDGDIKDNVSLIRLMNRPSWSDEVVTIRVTDYKFSVSDDLVDDPEILVDIDYYGLLDYILGVKGYWTLIFTSKIRVHPIWKLWKFGKVLNHFGVGQPWFWPRADFG